MTDQELIEGIVQHERKAFEFLVGHYQKQVIKTAYYFVGDLSEAEDLSQEIFMEVIDSIGKFNHKSKLSTWIYRITVNKSLNVVKKNKRKSLFSRLESIFHTAGSSVQEFGSALQVDENHLEEKEKSELMYNAISKLPENQRIAFTLNKFEELPYCEIAKVMETSLPAVESLIHRARMNLQKMLVINFSEYAKR